MARLLFRGASSGEQEAASPIPSLDPRVFAVTADNARPTTRARWLLRGAGALQAEYGVAGGLSDLGNLRDVPDFAPSVAVELIDPATSCQPMGVRRLSRRMSLMICSTRSR